MIYKGSAVGKAGLREGGVIVGAVNAKGKSVRLGLASPNGLLVTEVKKGSSAERPQIKVDDVILEINGIAFKDPEEFKELIAKGTIATVKVFREGKEIALMASTEF